MKIIDYIFVVTLLISTLSMQAVAEPDQNFHIYLMIGQSNMVGRADIQAEDQKQAEKYKRVSVLQDKTCPDTVLPEYGTWRLALPPLIQCKPFLGPGAQFGQEMADGSAEEVRIGLVGAATAGQRIEYFLKDCAAHEYVDDDDYKENDAKDACTPIIGKNTPENWYGGYRWLMDLARKAQQVGVIKGIIFHQGEANAEGMDEDKDKNWVKHVKQLVTDIRSDLGTGAIPFIAGELPYKGCCPHHNKLVNQLPLVISNAHVVTAEGEMLGSDGMKENDKYHWNSVAVREMGHRYAEKMLKLLNTPPAIVSDNTWKSYNSLQPGWESPLFDDSYWRNAYAPYTYQEPYTPDYWKAGTHAVYMWDWPDAGDPTGKNGPNEAWFRKTFNLSDASNITSAKVVLAADDDFDFYVNGTKVFSDWDNTVHTAPFTLDIKQYLVEGENVFAMYASDTYGAWEWALVDATIVEGGVKGDFNADGCVDREDLYIILTEIRNPAPHDSGYDLNGSGEVNIADARYLVTLFTNQGYSCF